MKTQTGEDIRDKTLRELEVEMSRVSPDTILVVLDPLATDETRHAFEDMVKALGDAYRQRDRAKNVAAALSGLIGGALFGFVVGRVG